MDSAKHQPREAQVNLFMASEPACSARNEMDLMVDNKLGLGSGFRSLGFRSSSTVHTHTCGLGGERQENLSLEQLVNVLA